MNIRVDIGGFLVCLTMVFASLKLCGAITWSWIWIVSPLWIGMIVAGTAIICCIALMIMVSILAALRQYGNTRTK